MVGSARPSEQPIDFFSYGVRSGAFCKLSGSAG